VSEKQQEAQNPDIEKLGQAFADTLGILYIITGNLALYLGRLLAGPTITTTFLLGLLIYSAGAASWEPSRP
jgi:hypothetical protein